MKFITNYYYYNFEKNIIIFQQWENLSFHLFILTSHDFDNLHAFAFWHKMVSSLSSTDNPITLLAIMLWYVLNGCIKRTKHRLTKCQMCLTVVFTLRMSSTHSAPETRIWVASGSCIEICIIMKLNTNKYKRMLKLISFFIYIIHNYN